MIRRIAPFAPGGVDHRHQAKPHSSKPDHPAQDALLFFLRLGRFGVAARHACEPATRPRGSKVLGAHGQSYAQATLLFCRFK